MTTDQLLPLPEPHSTVDVWGHDVNLYTRSQLRERDAMWADQLRAAVLQERERIADKVKSATILNGWDQDQLAAAIREGS